MTVRLRTLVVSTALAAALGGGASAQDGYRAYAYDPRLNRSVHVAASGIQEALLKVYGREALVKELNGK